MKSSRPVITFLKRARDRLAAAAGAPDAPLALRFTICRRVQSLAFAALLPVATLLVAPGAAAADPIVPSLEHENGNAGTLGVPPVANSLRAAIQEAHALPGGAQAVIRLKPETTYVIQRSTLVGGQTSEGTEHDPHHGDLDISRDLTIEGEGATIDAQGLGRIFDIRGDVRVTLRNLTLIRGGNFATGQAGAITDGGGAVRISGGAFVVFENVRFEDNKVVGSGIYGERRGGAIYVAGDGNDVHVRDCHFEGNGVQTREIGQVVAGGAIYHSGGLLSVARTRFIRCWAMQEPAGTSIFRTARGGAISVESGDVVIMASEFEENSARGADGVSADIADPRGQAAEGGAIYLGDGTGWFGAEDTVFRRNSAKAGRGSAAPGGAEAAFQRKGGTASGGAVFAKSAQAHFMMDFKRCLFEENLAFGQEGGYSPVLAGAGGDVRGGAFFVDGGALDLLDVKFRGNAAIAGDGGFTVAPHEMSLEGSSARGGSGGSARGGAVFVDSQTSAVYVRGSHQPEVSMESTNITASALFEGNHALGGYGRPGMDNREANGAGGPAAGGGMWIAAGHLELLNVFANGNSAQGGGGANLLGQSRFSEGDATNPTLFGPGGSNGEARGGFLYVTSAETRIEKSNLAFNRAAGGRLAGRVLHSVPPENNGVWSASQPETAVPFSAGNAGYGSIWAGIFNGARGGNGGDAHGGAIYGTRRLVLRQTGVMYNEAVGAHGGAGGRAKDTPGKAQRGGDGGRGGSAFGAGIALSNSASFDIEASMLFGNLAMAGSGGSGGQGSDNSNTTYNEDCDGCGGNGGFGGAGGSAAGGALFADCYSADPGQNARLVLCYVAENKAVAGDGFFGGNGGLGAGNVGGNGGLGGDGGNALGGGIATTALHMERSTVDQNLVSGGWGGSAGHGGVGSYAGGAGSVGGAAGQASGGGVFVRKPATLAPGARFVLSTLSNNRVYSGFGGQGGCGGPAYVFAGPGLNGGRNGLARGGGLFVEEGAAQVQLTDSTVAGNTVDAGGGGFAGIGAALIGGPVHPLDHPVRYQAATSVQLVNVGGLLVPAPPIAHGAASVLRDRTGFALGGPPSPSAYAAPLEHDGNGFVLFNEDRVSDVVATAAAATGAPIAATGALVGTAVFAGYLWANAGGFGAATTLALGGAGLAFAHVGAVGAVLAVGAVVAVTYIGAVIDTGDWALAAEYTLGTPGNVSRYNLGHLLTGAASRDDDDDGIIPQPGPNGAQGEYRAPEGSGIHGAASIRGTLVGDNSAFRRRRPFVEKKVGLVAFYEYDEFRDHLGSVSDLAGGVTSQGGNFVSVAPPGFTTSTHDIVGSSGSPLTARVAPSVGDHGGGVPTLKLRPGSPARGAVPLGGQQSESQNGFTWAAGGSRDIGAWGGPPNRPPVAANQVFRLVQGSGGSASFGTLGLAASQFDPDGDELSIVLQETVNTGGAWIVYLILGDPVNRGFTYTPAQNFAGIQEIFHFSVTDGEFESNVGTIYAQVVPPEAAFQCPPGGSGRIIPIGSESSTIGTARHVEFPASARVDHNFTGPFTVEFWMNLIRPSGWAHEHEPLITKGDSAWRVQRAGFTSKLAFDVTGLEPLSLHSQRDVLQGWHHVAAVYDGKHKLLYIDGELDSWQEVTGVPAVNDEPVWLGGNSEWQDRRFRGFMDEVRVWNYARSATEIRENFVRVLSGYEPGLLTYHTFEEPEANLVFNYAMNGTSEPSQAVPREDDQPAWRPSFSIDKVASPILWEFGTRVVGRHLFYNQSAFDGNDPEATAADDDAIAPNIEALLPGETAGERNRSSYSRGINGIIIDIANLRSPLALSEEDFEFAAGNDSDPDSWTPAEPPASILVRPGAGACGSTRITLAWADYQADPSVPNRAVGNGWLRVTVRANTRTGLHHDDVFYFGSCIGESDDADFLVSAADALRALNHMVTSASLLDPYDFNRDGIVSAQDALIALNHMWTSFHLPDLRVGPYKGIDVGGAAGSPGLMSHSSPAGAVAAAPLFIGPAAGSRIQLTVPPITTGRGDVAGLILTAPTPSGPWSLLPGGLVPRLPDRDFTIELTPDQPAAFYRLETDTDSPAY